MDAISGLLAALRSSEAGIYRNAQIKRYPDGSAAVMVFDRAIIRARGWEAVAPAGRENEAPEGAEDRPTDEKRTADNLARSRRRARSNVFDIARATDFSYFVTLTVDPDKLNRYDVAEVFRHLHDWLDNNVRRHGLAYVLVPELHKDGAVHFHALFNDALGVVDSGTISLPGGGKPRRPRCAADRRRWLAAGGQVVYNLPAWGWGFTTAIRLYGDREAAVGYVVKYITKTEAKIGGRWYYSGGALQRPDVMAADLDYTEAAALAQPFEVEDLGCHGVKLFLKGDEVSETMAKLRRPS